MAIRQCRRSAGAFIEALHMTEDAHCVCRCGATLAYRGLQTALPHL